MILEFKTSGQYGITDCPYLRQYVQYNKIHNVKVGSKPCNECQYFAYKLEGQNKIYCQHPRKMNFEF